MVGRYEGKRAFDMETFMEKLTFMETLSLRTLHLVEHPLIGIR